MVCGFGDAVSYETLAARLAKARIDKSQRFTDWSHRPLQERQLSYALADVTHLRQAYEKLGAAVEKEGRAEWVTEEMAVLTDPATYRLEPEEAWRRLKPRTGNARTLMLLKALAAWREREAQTRDLPRQRVIRDEALLEIAASAPATIEDLAPHPGPVARPGRRTGRAPRSSRPWRTRWRRPKASGPRSRPGWSCRAALRRWSICSRCCSSSNATRTTSPSGWSPTQPTSRRSPATTRRRFRRMHGWRRSLFGDDALRLKHGKVALALAENGKGLRLIPLD